jgi:hypothetical protein
LDCCASASVVVVANVVIAMHANAHFAKSDCLTQNLPKRMNYAVI